MQPHTDHTTTPIPIWRQIATELETGIADGTWPPDTPIPSETQLVQQHGIARGTARKAMKHLAEQDLITQVQGKGSYVTRREGPMRQ